MFPSPSPVSMLRLLCVIGIKFDSRSHHKLVLSREVSRCAGPELLCTAKLSLSCYSQSFLNASVLSGSRMSSWYTLSCVCHDVLGCSQCPSQARHRASWMTSLRLGCGDVTANFFLTPTFDTACCSLGFVVCCGDAAIEPEPPYTGFAHSRHQG